MKLILVLPWKLFKYLISWPYNKLYHCYLGKSKSVGQPHEENILILTYILDGYLRVIILFDLVGTLEIIWHRFHASPFPMMVKNAV